MIMPGLSCLPYVEVVEPPTTITDHTAPSVRQLLYDHTPADDDRVEHRSDGGTDSVDCSTSISRSHDVSRPSGTHRRWEVSPTVPGVSWGCGVLGLDLPQPRHRVARCAGAADSYLHQ
jgi:hypothetical protein